MHKTRSQSFPKNGLSAPAGQAASGFTLIELLTVIAIIAILAGLLFPVFLTARGKARAARINSARLREVNVAGSAMTDQAAFRLRGFRYPATGVMVYDLGRNAAARGNGPCRSCQDPPFFASSSSPR